MFSMKHCLSRQPVPVVPRALVCAAYWHGAPRAEKTSGVWRWCYFQDFCSCIGVAAVAVHCLCRSLRDPKLGQVSLKRKFKHANDEACPCCLVFSALGSTIDLHKIDSLQALRIEQCSVNVGRMDPWTISWQEHSAHEFSPPKNALQLTPNSKGWSSCLPCFSIWGIPLNHIKHAATSCHNPSPGRHQPGSPGWV